MSRDHVLRLRVQADSDLRLFLRPCSAITEYRISKRVEEQFQAFMSGFNELIPQELINVFDERELEVSAT